jgi:putative flippase GtrA
MSDSPAPPLAGPPVRQSGRLTLHKLSKLVRFGAIGLFNSLLYAFLSSLLISYFKLAPTLSSAIAFSACLPLSFWSHKRITFLSGNKASDEFIKFGTVQGISFCVALALMYGVTQLGLHYAFAILSTLIVVPYISFIAMDRWVFRLKGPQALGRKTH